MWKLTLLEPTGEQSFMFLLKAEPSIKNQLRKEGRKILKIERNTHFEVKL